jgi:3-methyl-2-oxobutanoate hydroxymethyltransferase
MSHVKNRASRSILDFAKYKAEKKKFSVVTCYDASFAKLINRTSIDMVLVGDSLGNVMLGFDDTIRVTMDHMVHHCSAVSRVLDQAFLVGDLPFGSYHESPEQAVRNAVRLMQEGGVQAVKVEGGQEIAAQIEKIVKAGIPVVGHLGLTPQSVHLLGGFRVQGRTKASQDKLMVDAKSLQDAGAMAVVVELMQEDCASQLSSMLRIPTIGIGAGSGCDGQVLVLQDLLGFDSDFRPKFLKTYANLAETVIEAISQYDSEVKAGIFPAREHSFEAD